MTVAASLDKEIVRTIANNLEHKSDCIQNAQLKVPKVLNDEIN